jgi:replication factor A3
LIRKPAHRTNLKNKNFAIMSEATPRITAPYLEQFSHQTVRILGKVRQLRGETATIDAGGQISVFLTRVCI